MEKKPAKLFISHSSKDIAFVRPLVDLLKNIGLSSQNMVCSSVPGYHVPLDEDIYDYLSEQFRHYDLHVIFVLSDNYYNSIACLNEMGAAWVLRHKYTSILLPSFSFKKLDGAINPRKIAISLGSTKSDLSLRLTELKNTLLQEFELPACNEYIWEEDRARFMDRVMSRQIYWDMFNELPKNNSFDEHIRVMQDMLATFPQDAEALCVLGNLFAETKQFDKAANTLKDAIKYAEDTNVKNQSILALQMIEQSI